MTDFKTLTIIGLGSNLGDRNANLGAAVEALAGAGLLITARSSVYRTEPVGLLEQGEFLNQVIACRSILPPGALLETCLQIERAMGRIRTRPMGPRTIDIDLLLHGDAVVREGELEVPHPRMHLRRFVLVPLVEIAPDVRHPVLGATAAELLARCGDRSRVEPLPR